VFENDVHVDVLVARSAATKDDSSAVHFDDVLASRESVPYSENVSIVVPAISDLIRTKRWGLRTADIADIQLLEAMLRTERQRKP